MAVKSISRYTAADDSLVRMHNGTSTLPGKLHSISKDSNLLRVSVERKEKWLKKYQKKFTMCNDSHKIIP